MGKLGLINDIEPTGKLGLINDLPGGFKGGGVTGTWEENPSVLRQVGNVARDIGASVLNPEVGGSILKAIPNVPESGINYLKNMATAVIPKKESYYIPGGEMARGVGNLAIGGVEKLIPGEQGKEKYADAVGQFYKKRYGGGENVKNTFINDPVGFGADVSTLLNLTGTGANLAGKLLKPAQTTGTSLMTSSAEIPQGISKQPLSTLERIGSEMKQIGSAIEPTNLAIKAITPPIKIAGSIASQIWGRLLHGGGAETNKIIFEGAPDFEKTLRGEITREEVVGNAKDALNKMNQARSLDFEKRINAIPNTKPIDITPIRNVFIGMLNRFKIKYNPDTGGLFFTKYSEIIDPADQKELNTLFERLKNWGSDPEDLLPKNVHSLKKIIGNIYTENSPIKPIIAATYSKTRQVLVDNVPEYKSIMSDFETSKKVTDQIQRALSLGKEAHEVKNTDTALKKLMSTMRENFEFRRDLLGYLEENANKDLLGQIAGLTMNSWIPRGLIGKGLDSAFLAKIMFTHSISPTLGAVLLVSSPKVAGEFINYLGKSSRLFTGIGRNKIISNPAFRQGAFQAGRISNIEEQPEWNRRPDYLNNFQR